MLQLDSLRTGQLCPHCDQGRVFVRRSARRGVCQVRYYECRHCGQRTRAVVPSDTVPTRRPNAIGPSQVIGAVSNLASDLDPGDSAGDPPNNQAAA